MIANNTGYDKKYATRYDVATNEWTENKCDDAACKYCSARPDKHVPEVGVPKPKYSHYYKDVTRLTTIDVYEVCQLFNVDDPSGATQHAIKKLLLSGQRGVKTKLRDIKEASDTLNRLIDILEEREIDG